MFYFLSCCEHSIISWFILCKPCTSSSSEFPWPSAHLGWRLLTEISDFPEMAHSSTNKAQIPRTTQTSASALSCLHTQRLQVFPVLPPQHDVNPSHLCFSPSIQGVVSLHLDLKQPLGAPDLESFSSPNTLLYWSLDFPKTHRCPWKSHPFQSPTE